MNRRASYRWHVFNISISSTDKKGVITVHCVLCSCCFFILFLLFRTLTFLYDVRVFFYIILYYSHEQFFFLFFVLTFTTLTYTFWDDSQVSRQTEWIKYEYGIYMCVCVCIQWIVPRPNSFLFFLLRLVTIEKVIFTRNTFTGKRHIVFFSIFSVLQNKMNDHSFMISFPFCWFFFTILF